MRQHLLQVTEGPLREGRLSVEEVQDAEALFLCNSVRGLVQVAEAMTGGRRTTWSDTFGDVP